MRESDPTAPVRVFLADDHAVVRSGIHAFFDMLDDIEVVGEAADGQAVLDAFEHRAARSDLPHVVLMDLVMPGLDGVSATRELKRLYPAVEVVAMTSFSEAERVRAALEAGASGYVLKDAVADEVAAAVRTAYRGGSYLAPAVARKLTQSMSTAQRSVTALTAREREVLALVAQGKSNRGIAETLVISERTARTHVSKVLNKLGFASRTQAALWAIEEGLSPRASH
ncbi:response regulator [Streptomyces sp. NPDC059477]|uniref:response regulator n=1 Tax=Streptomyces sp. NPDC059477 TaxID=3346847 RepID=UPI0036BEC069